MFNEWIGVKSGFGLPDSGLVNTISSRSSSLEGFFEFFITDFCDMPFWQHLDL